MANILIWILACFVGLIGGIIIVMPSYLIYGFIRDRFFSDKVPKNPKEVSEYILQNKDKLKAGSNIDNNKKEVQDDEQRRFEQSRTYAKLRRIAEISNTKRGNDQLSPGVTPEQGRGVLSNSNVTSSPGIQSTNNQLNKPSKGVVRFD